jgi:amino acid adenylation domain-containing protein
MNGVERIATQADFPRDGCLHQLFEARARETPDAVAVVWEDRHLTYAELNRRADRLARQLCGCGVGPDVLVGLCTQRSLEMVTGLLGILKAGGAYVPLDPTYPRDRLAYMMEDARLPALVTEVLLREQLPAHGARVLCLDKDIENHEKNGKVNPTVEVTAEHLAYVIYTSGSTGKPKGVPIIHRAVVNFLGSMRREPGLTAQDVLLAVTTLSFDIAALEIFLPISVGGRVVLASREVARDGAKLAAYLDRCGATVMQATPATWQLLLTAGWQGSDRLKILCGGEALPCSLAKQLRQRSAALWNLYGPTETTIWSAAHEVGDEDGVVPIGKPIANTQIHVLDERRRPVPVGEVGELYIGGVGLARGYLNQPELTAAKFIPDPFSQEPGARLYQTGDRGRCQADGTLEFLGRMDHQVKIRGFRVELGEIETVLAQHREVARCAVLAREETDGLKRLVAYVVPRRGQVPAIGALRRFLEQRLPEHTIPSAFVFLDTLPLTPNGKVNRLALPAPKSAGLERNGTQVAPRTALEQQLADIWAEVLDAGPVGVNEGFFQMGGDSLLAARLLAQIEKTFGKPLPVNVIFEAPTIALLAARLELMPETWTSPASPQIGTARPRPPFFCLSYAPTLALELADQPVYALEIAADAIGALPDLQAMGRHLIEKVRAIQPRGPYLLGGYCNPGIVAYEIARQLCEQGDEVALLALFDADLPAATPGHQRGFRRALSAIGYYVNRLIMWDVRNLAQLPVAYWTSYLWERVQTVRDIIVARIPALARRYGVPSWVHIRRAVCSYAPGNYPGRITLFVSSKTAADFRHDPSLGWRNVAQGGLDIHVIPGHHVTMFQPPYVQALVEPLNRCLMAADTAAKDRADEGQSARAAGAPARPELAEERYR